MNILNSAITAAGFRKIDCSDDKVTKQTIKCLNVINALSWIPILGAIVGVVRIVVAPIFYDKMCKELSLEKQDKQFGKAVVTWSIIRGSCEILTLGFFAPINIVADSISSIITKNVVSRENNEIN